MSDAQEIPVIKITAARQDADLLNELLYTVDLQFAQWTTKTTCRVDVFCAGAEELAGQSQLLRERAVMWNDLLVGDLSFEETTIKREDWAEVWKRYFHAERMSPRITIKPSWEELATEPTECVVEIDPGMSFGTGRHGTTAACLQLVDELSARVPGARFLDIGCGSGILSIAALKLGLKDVTLFDFDPKAVECAEENLALNHVVGNIFVADVGEYCTVDPYQLVFANLESSILLPNVTQICSCVANGPDCYLVLSGILKVEYERVLSVFLEHGFEEIRSIQLDEWQTAFLKRI